MKKVLFLMPLIFVACAIKPNANSVAELSGDMEVVGWKEKPKKVCEVKDSDGDGVIDKFDRCPNTKRGISVDKNGCAKLTEKK
jgi:OOP family OmpA-OmpF porin